MLVRRAFLLVAVAGLVGGVSACSSDSTAGTPAGGLLSAAPHVSATGTSGPIGSAGANAGAVAAGSQAAAGAVGRLPSPTASVNHGRGQGTTVLGVPTSAGCDPTLFVNRAAPAGGALTTYLFKPFAAKDLAGSGTKVAVAKLHAGEAVRFATHQLTAARASLSTCPVQAAPLTTAVDTTIVDLRALATVFAGNRVPTAAAIATAQKALAAMQARGKAVRIVIKDVVPTLIQVESGN